MHVFQRGELLAPASRRVEPVRLLLQLVQQRMEGGFGQRRRLGGRVRQGMGLAHQEGQIRCAAGRVGVAGAQRACVGEGCPRSALCRRIQLRRPERVLLKAACQQPRQRPGFPLGAFHPVGGQVAPRQPPASCRQKRWNAFQPSFQVFGAPGLRAGQQQAHHREGRLAAVPARVVLARAYPEFFQIDPQLRTQQPRVLAFGRSGGFRQGVQRRLHLAQCRPFARLGVLSDRGQAVIVARQPHERRVHRTVPGVPLEVLLDQRREFEAHDGLTSAGGRSTQRRSSCEVTMALTTS